MRAVAFVLLVGCGSSPNVTSVKSALGVGAALGLAAHVGLEALSGTSIACTKVTTPCATYPCQGKVAMTLIDACVLPFGTGDGDVEIDASLTSATAGAASTAFVASVVLSAQSVAVTPTRVSYTGQDVVVRDVALASQSSWTVDIDDRGTADPSDDRYTLAGNDQSVGSAVDQTSVTGAVLDPSCHLNPIAGTASIQHVAGLDIEQDQVAFHAACDGLVDVVTTTGSHTTARID